MFWDPCPNATFLYSWDYIFHCNGTLVHTFSLSQAMINWLWLTFSDVMSKSLFGVFCQKYPVNTVMHHDCCQVRVLSLPNGHTQVPRIHLWSSMGCCGSPCHGRLTYISGMLSGCHFSCICWKVWKLSEGLFLYCAISLAIWQHSSYVPDFLADKGKMNVGFSRQWINPAPGN